MLRWNKLDIPHKGWEYIGMEDLGEDIYPGTLFLMSNVKCVEKKKFAMFIC